jgi:antiviral defense system Shedu protein SduA
MEDPDEHTIYLRSRTDKTYVGPSFPTFNGRRLRIANKYVDGGEGYEFATVKDEVVLRSTPAGRVQIKATFVEDDRSFQTLTIQKFTGSGRAREYFTFLPAEIATLLNFLSNIKRISFPNEGKINITDADLEELLLSPDQMRRLAADNQELLAALARTEITSEDIVALGYRRKQLRIFGRLLSDPSYFEAALRKHPKGPEDVWQKFFEANPWIFGCGLSLICFGPLDKCRLEQTVRGFDLTGPGKRVDALLKSHAMLSTTCFVEIKRHDTELVAESSYRAGIWRPSKELSGAVAQIQGTVSAALEQWQARETISTADGEPTGETLFTTEPRSFVICGSLGEFQAEHGINERKFRSFELYRRNLIRPEIVTFDELFERARFIVEAERKSDSEAVS